MRSSVFFVATLLAAAGCAAGTDGTGGDDGSGGDGSGGDGSGGSIVGTGGDGAGGGLNVGGTGGGGGNPNLIAEVFGHSDDTLYRLDPDTKQFSTIGMFSGCDNVTDIALDKDSALFATTLDDGLYRIDPLTASCTLVKAGEYPNSLSLVPQGTLDANEEALVGYYEADYVRIDKTTGAVTTINPGALGSYVSSGDLVSVIDGPTYLTIKSVFPDTSCNDCLVRIDPTSGEVLQNYGDIGYEQVFGIGFWAGAVYGFTNSGQLFEITVENNVLNTSALTTPAGLKFWGAGSTTSAPPEPVPK